MVHQAPRSIDVEQAGDWGQTPLASIYDAAKSLWYTILGELLQSDSNSKRKNITFANDMKELMSCPWETNITQKERYRVELYACCNATEDLILTTQNTVLNQTITYDGVQLTRLVDNSLLEMLPKRTPWRTGGQLGRCSVVGNSGILKNSRCGSKINRADFVIRLNLAPINFSRDVGVKTNLMTANPTQIKRSYPNLKKHPQPLVDDMSKYGDASLLMPPFAYRSCTKTSFQVHQALRPLYPQQKVVFFNPNYLRDLHRYWRRRGQRALRLSTGLMLASVALELCDEVHLYGFWPFNFDLSLKQLSHHYYDDVGPRPGAHSMPQEFLQLLNMHSKGAINLHVGKCQ
ncbi:alpha-2,8-sialyltransferase 8F-like [Conger conger]|uniref:alpha-2,8-sialyltransferase 8F-like n=1 Tax=Conger conger TaxID=82655 RepID=UPI002A5A1E31|nr:alpha-2,8-sialyltransferase 8F-like [Conger conger]